MKKLIIAALMVVGIAGVSIAQTAPVKTTTHSKTQVKTTHKHGGKHTSHHVKKAHKAVK